MSAQPFEIRCPACGSVVPPDARGCGCATAASKKRQAVAEAPTVAALAPVSAPVAVPGDVANMRLKDYHRLVRSNYRAVEGPFVASRPGVRLYAYLPFVILALALLVGAAVALGKL